MWDFFSKFEFWQILILVSITVVLILLCRPYIRLGDKFILGFSGRQKPRHHFNCQNNSDFKRLMVETIKTMSKYDELKFVKCLDLQMSVVEENEVIIKSLFLSTFGKELMKITNSTDIVEHSDYRAYADIVTMMLELNVRKLFFHAFKQNNITKFNNETFRDYVKSKCEVIFNTGSLFMDGHYNGDKMIISREALREANASIKKDVFELTLEAFTRARDIEISIDKELDQLLDDLNKFCDTFTSQPSDVKPI